MSYEIKRRAIPAARDPANRGTLEAMAMAVNELSGTIGQAADRAVRVGELLAAGVMQLNVVGVLEKKEAALLDNGPIEIADVGGLQAALDAKQGVDTAWNTSNFDPGTKVDVGSAFYDAFASTPLYYNGSANVIDCDNLVEGTRALVSGGGANANYPSAGFWHIETARGYTAGTKIQRAWSYTQAGRHATRNYNGAAWTAWALDWNSANFDPTTKYDKTGGTITGNVTIAGGGRALSVGSWAQVSSGGDGKALFSNNAYYNEADNTYRWANTHTSIGASGIVLNPFGNAGPYFFDMGDSATTAGSAFTPTLQNLVCGDDTVRKVLAMTETAYNNLATKDPLTAYILV